MRDFSTQPASRFNRKLAAYSGVALMAGGAMASSASAAIITTAFTGGGGTRPQSMTAGGVNVGDFAEDGATPPTSGDVGKNAYLKAGADDTVGAKFIMDTGVAGPDSVLKNLAGGTVVGPSQAFGAGAGGNTNTGNVGFYDTTNGTNYAPAGFASGEFPLGQLGYAGVSFTLSGAGHLDYGYYSLTVTAPVPGGDVLFTGTLTYDDTGAAVTVPGGAVPEPASLGLLALGAVGMLRRRTA